jgi:hypothetical protein
MTRGPSQFNLTAGTVILATYSCIYTQCTSFVSPYFLSPLVVVDYALAQLVEALRYKPKVRGFDSRWGHWNFSVT